MRRIVMEVGSKTTKIWESGCLETVMPTVALVDADDNGRPDGSRILAVGDGAINVRV